MSAAVKIVDTEEDSPKKQKATKHVELPKPEVVEAQAKSPYPEGVRTFSYQPKGGGDPIVLPLNGFEQPDKLWLFDVAQLPNLAQTWRWMTQAKVPKDIQRQAQTVPDAEYFGMFDEWFEAVAASRGPKGTLTSGK